MAIDIYDYFRANANRSGLAKPATIYSVTKIDKGDDTSLLMNAGLYLSPTAEDDIYFSVHTDPFRGGVQELNLLSSHQIDNLNEMTIPLRTLFNDMVAQYVKENEYCPPLFRKSTAPILRIMRPNYEDLYMLEHEFKIHFSASETDVSFGKEIDLSNVKTKYYDDIRLTGNEETLSFIVAEPGDIVKFGSEPCLITDETVIYRSETNPEQIFMMEAHSFATSHRILGTFKSNAPLRKHLNIIPFKPKTVRP